MDDVCQWLSALGLPEHEEKFRDNAIDGKELLALTTADLEALGVGQSSDLSSFTQILFLLKISNL